MYLDKLNGIIGAALMAALIGGVMGLSANAQTFNVTVPGNSGLHWVNTGRYISPNTRVQQRATGTISLGGDRGVFGPEGTSAFVVANGYPAETPRRYGLVARLTASTTNAEDDLRDTDRDYGSALRAFRAWFRVRGRGPGPLYPSRQHRPISRRRLDSLMKEYCQIAGIAAAKAHFHVLKQSCAEHVRKRLCDPAIVRDWLGYEDRSSRMRYKHTWLRPKYRREATAERLKDFGALAA